MKAIYINSNFNSIGDLDKLNRELKDCQKILKEITLINGCGIILIASNYTRKDKLKKLEKISKSEKRTANNSI